jgi:hypothetical protein
MSEEQINIAIEEIIRPALHGNIYRPPRDFCNDLNAMHEEIMSLEGLIRDHSYRRALAKSVGVIGFEDWEHSLVCLDKLTNATARQRAEAFLRTLGKWKEETK